MKIREMTTKSLPAEKVERYDLPNGAGDGLPSGVPSDMNGQNGSVTPTGPHLGLSGSSGNAMTFSALQNTALLELSRFIDHVPALGWSASPDGSLDYINQRFLDYTGLSLVELRRSGWNSIVHRDDIALLESWTQVTRQSREGGTTEVRLRRFDGSYRCFLAFANPLRDESGSIVAWYGTNIDIEDRKQVEATLRARESSWLQVVDNIPGLVATMGATGEVEFLNRQTLEYFGKSSDDLKNWALSDAIHPDDLPRIIQARIKSIEEGGIYEVEHRCRRADGVYRWFQVRGIPMRDAENAITAWYLLLTDIEDRKSAERELQERELNLRLITQTIPGMLWSATPQGEVDYCNRPWLDFTAMAPEQARGWGWTAAIHRDDRDGLIESWRSCLASGTPFDVEARMRRFDAAYRWFLFRANPLRDESGKIVRWYGTSTEIEDSKRREEGLQASELSWRQIVDNIPGLVAREGPMGEIAFNNRQTLEYFGKTSEELRDWSRIGIVHPDDLPELLVEWGRSIETGHALDKEARLRRADGIYRWFQVRAVPARGADDEISDWYVLLTDIDDRKRAEQLVAQSEAELRTITETIRQPIIVLAPDGATLYVNQVALDLTGYTRSQIDEKGFWAGVTHPEDVNLLREVRREKFSRGVPFELEFRALFKNGEYRWQLMQYNPLKDESGQLIRWYATATDIDDRKRMEERLRQEGDELRTITDAIRQPIIVLAPDGTTVYANRVACEQTGLTLDEVIEEGVLARVCHPDDIERARGERRVGLLGGIPFDLEIRLLYKKRDYRWALLQYNPLRNDSGQILRWYCTSTDIDDRKRAEELLRKENVKLAQERVYFEEQIRSEMGFEQIIGNSPTLKHVLELVETVAPSDSTVLLLGETGTGKELIARAVHELSRRKGKTFVKLNCAAIPTGLLESELFGHEKGAFTGAIIQKVGRMELADQGTLFLDEVGDIPVDIQPKLLRALQEKEFERLGSTHTRKANLRLVAATNRNLERMVTDREFRSDLFYRLNVFPIRIPPLRDRKEDIPLLVAYFVQKFAKQMQKRIDSIPVATMKALAAWDWPGNIRELENFIERAVILTHGESLSAPLAELRKVTIEEPVRESGPKAEDDIARIVKETIASLKSKSAPSERTKKQQEEIVRVLTECKGRVGGSEGAAAHMGLSRTTLISRMKKLGINPYDFA
jgi:PAS domain S-box-containing protein